MQTEKMLQTEERWLSCRLDKGMFSDEVAVTYPPKGASSRSVFVPRTAVIGEAGKVGKVRVKILRNNGKLIAMLPTPHSEVVEVAESDVIRG